MQACLHNSLFHAVFLWIRCLLQTFKSQLVWSFSVERAAKRAYCSLRPIQAKVNDLKGLFHSKAAALLQFCFFGLRSPFSWHAGRTRTISLVIVDTCSSSSCKSRLQIPVSGLLETSFSFAPANSGPVNWQFFEINSTYRGFFPGEKLFI